MPEVVQSATLSPSQTPFSWYQELVRGTPGHMIMAGLFVYFILNVIPNMQESYEQKLAQQRAEFLNTLEQKDIRHEARLKSVEQDCYDLSRSSNELMKKHDELARQIYSMLLDMDKQRKK